MNKLAQTRIVEISTLHNEIEGDLKMCLAKAIRIGELLTQVKDELKHGEFTPWMKENLPFTGRTGQNYMRVFNNKDKILEAGSVGEAYKILEAPKSETVSFLGELSRYIEALKSCSIKFKDYEEGGPIYVPADRFDETVFKALGGKLDEYKTEFDRILKRGNSPEGIQQLTVLEDEAGRAQSRLSEVHIWISRIYGQILNTMPKKEISQEIRRGKLTRGQCTESKKLANMSHETIEDIINEILERQPKTETVSDLN